MSEQSGLFYPNRLARFFFLAMEEVIGTHGLSAIVTIARLNQYAEAFPPDTLAREFDFASLAALSQALEDMYGVRGGRGMAERIGRAWLANGMKQFGALAGIDDPAFRALPLPDRCKLGLQALADVFTIFTDQRCHLEEDDHAYRFVVASSPMAWGRKADKPVCHALVGLVAELMRWASNGYDYAVQEVACTVTDAPACVFTISKKPMG